MRDLVIIGAGPAGITAAVYAARKRLDFLVVSSDIGGQTAWSADVENYTGYQFITGLELVAKFEEHLKQFHVEVKEGESVTRVEKTARGSFLAHTAKASYEARAVIVASGRRPRWLDVKGEQALRNRGVSYCATCDGPLFADKEVAIVGGGNSALDAALQMMKIASKVYLVNLNPALGGDPIMREKVEASPKVTVLNGAVTREVLGEAFVRGLRVEHQGRIRELGVQGVFVEIGSVPNSDIVDFVDRNKSGEIIVDNLNRTSAPGVFAAGDVTDVPEKQIIVAAGEGAKSVLGVFHFLSRAEEGKG
jgi:alkyl hydroperoxide reductase subunit F